MLFNVELMTECKILSRIVEKYLEISGLTVDQVVKFLKDGKGKSDTLSNKIRNVKDVWDKRTQIDLEDVLEWYILLVYLSHSQSNEQHQNATRKSY